jgi:hypothetical protein
MPLTDDVRARLVALEQAAPPMRCGTKVGRTIYRGHDANDLIGVMDTRALAELTVELRNAAPTLLASDAFAAQARAHLQEALVIMAGLYHGTDWELAPSIRTTLKDRADKIAALLRAVEAPPTEGRDA